MKDILYWAVGLILLGGLAYYILSTQAVSVPATPAPSCNKCPKMNKTNTEIQPWS
jgi:hypothetical protein